MKSKIRTCLVVVFAALFLVSLSGLSEAFSDGVMKKSDEMKQLASQKKEMPAEMAGVKKISADELKKWLDEGKAIVVLDNRPAKEYETEHITGAKRVGVDELLKNGIKEAEAAGVKKDDIIVNY